jgi:hypothetical protein
MTKPQKFKPRAEAGLLRDRLLNSWQVRYRDNVESKKAEVGERLARHLEGLYPADDMATLSRYDCTRLLTEASVHVYNKETERWDAYFSMELPRGVIVPTSANPISCGGPWWSRNPNRGVKAETRERMKVDGEWQKFCDDQDKRERERVPEDLEEFFYMLVRERNTYQRDQRECCAWPDKYKTEHGDYPTWEQIAAEFPVLLEGTRG